MAASINPTSAVVKELAGLLVAVAGESVTMVKRTVPEQSLKLKQRGEWGLYLEFLKLLFDLADRLSVFHIPVSEQPHFMQTLEETITQQLNTMLEPALGSQSDEMEIFLTITQAVAEGRHQYERFRFPVIEESEVKQQYLQSFSQRIAGLMDAPDNGMVLSAATLCATAAIPAIKAVLAGAGSPDAADQPADAAARTKSGSDAERRRPGGPGLGKEIKLLSIISTIEGEQVETRWGLHPRFKQDLQPEQVQELTRTMNRVTQILGHRYAAVGFSTEWAPWNRIGHA
jgi:hypothetical protein